MLDPKSEISIIIPAGGKGERLKDFLNGENKQFSKLGEKMILEIVIERLNKLINFREFVIAFPNFLENEFEDKKNLFLKKFPFLKIVEGGESRFDSVFSAINNLNYDEGRVLIHDAVRPFFTEKNIKILLEISKTKKNVIMAVKSKDTIREFNENYSVKTLDREKIYLVQTPQIFDLNILKKAYLTSKNNNFSHTDDAGALEYIGEKVFLCEGNSLNFKITTETDYILAKIIFEQKILENL